jgi:hypothetical protein
MVRDGVIVLDRRVWPEAISAGADTGAAAILATDASQAMDVQEIPVLVSSAASRKRVRTMLDADEDTLYGDGGDGGGRDDHDSDEAGDELSSTRDRPAKRGRR